jgi:predicted DCC family thiol-disulfide oxidoreductase YuxK
MDTVLYDGQCVFCTRGVATLRRLDVFGSLEFVSLHDPSVSARFPDLTYDMLMDQMWVVARTGKRYGGSDAIRYLSRRLPLLFPFAPILHLPGTRSFWRWAYRQVADRRYRFAGKHCDNGTCSLHARSGAKVESVSK